MNNSFDGFNNNPLNANQNNNNFHPSNRRKQSLWWIPVTTILGFFAVIAISFFAVVAFFTTFVENFNLSFGRSPVYVAENSILKLNFSELNEVNLNENPFVVFSNKTPKPTFYQVIEGIKRAANDDRITGIFYEGTSSLSGAMAKELQTTLMKFKNSGKFIYSFLETTDKRQYYTALVSDSIFVPDVGIYEFSGFGASIIMPKGLYDKIGLEFTVTQFEDFKMAGEQYDRKKISDSAKFAYRILIAQTENDFIATVAERRGLSKKTVIEYMKKGIIDSDEMIELKLADAKASRQEVIKFLTEKSNNNFDENENNSSCNSCGCADCHNNLINISDYILDTKNREKINYKDDAIAIITGEGVIISTKQPSPFAQGNSIVSRDFVKLIRKAKNDETVKGIIIRINSPGGSAIAAEEIYQEILEAKKVKPVYASMSNIAASGGYYIAMACDTIIAHPHTVTGSIGVVAAFPNFSKLISNLHMNVDTISTGTGNSYFMSPFLHRKNEDALKFEKMSYSIYKSFVTKAAESRNMSFDAMRKVAKGRIWTGEDALKNGLVDALGDLQLAIDLMNNRILGDDFTKRLRLKFLPTETDKWEAFMKLFDDFSVTAAIDVITGRISKNSKQDFANSLMIPQEVQRQFSYLQTLAFISEKEKVMMAMPNLIEIR